jgi:DNA invertase Pin-like site-specific DNA recombinase
MKIGYKRISLAEKNAPRQEVLMQEMGVDVLFVDKVSGKNTKRTKLQKMLYYVRKGDTVIVDSISRFATNTKDLLELIDQLKEKGVEFISRQENIDTSTPNGKFLLSVFKAVAELEREYLLQRQAQGIAIARQNGKYKGRKKIVNDKFEAIYKEWKGKNITAVRAMDLLGMKRNTFYRRVAEYEAEQLN